MVSKASRIAAALFQGIGDGLQGRLRIIKCHSTFHLLFQVLSGIVLRLQLLPAATGLAYSSHSVSSHFYFRYKLYMILQNID